MSKRLPLNSVEIFICSIKLFIPLILTVPSAREIFPLTLGLSAAPVIKTLPPIVPTAQEIFLLIVGNKLKSASSIEIFKFNCSSLLKVFFLSDFTINA